MTGLGGTTRGKICPEAYSPTGRGSGGATEFERKPPTGESLVAVGGRSGQLFRETGLR